MFFKTSMIYIIRAIREDGTQVNGMWPNSIPGNLFLNLENGQIEKYLFEHEHALVGKNGTNFSLIELSEGGVAVRAVTTDANTSDSILSFFRDKNSTDNMGLMLKNTNTSYYISLLGSKGDSVDGLTHLHAPEGKEFKVVLYGDNEFDIFVVDSGKGGVSSLTLKYG